MAMDPKSSEARVAVVGGGIAGLASAWFLAGTRRVTLYERETFLGGHARSVPVDCGGGVVVPVETGFKYVMDGSHTMVLALMRLLGLSPEKRTSSMTIDDRRLGRFAVLPPRRPRHVAQLLGNLGFLPRLLGLRRFLASGPAVVAAADWAPTLAEHAAALGLSEAFTRDFLLPLCASTWGAPLADMNAFPAYDVLKNMWKGATGFYEIAGGASAYIAALVGRLDQVDLRLGRPVARILPAAGGKLLVDDGERAESYDQVVVATPAWHAADVLAALPDAAPTVALLRELRSFATDIYIHGDTSLMPRARADWSVINHVFADDHFCMTEWSGHHHGQPVFRSWIRDRPPPDKVHAHRAFAHLLVTSRNRDLQRALDHLQGTAGVWLAGMYTTDVDDHESALLSALRVADALAPASPRAAELRAAASLPAPARP